MTTSRLRGMSRSMFFRLCVRAPRMLMQGAQRLGQRAAVRNHRRRGRVGHDRGRALGTRHDSHAGRAVPTRGGKTTLGENTGFA